MNPVQIVRASKDGISKVKQTPELCKLAVQTHGTAIKYIENQTDELKWLAVRRSAKSLKYISLTDEMCLEAIKMNWYAIQYITDPTEEMIEAAIEIDYEAIMFVQQTPELCAKVLELNPYALSLIDDKFLTDEMLEKYLPLAPVILPNRFNRHFYELAVKADPTLLPQVPKEFVTEQMCFDYVKSRNGTAVSVYPKFSFPDNPNDSFRELFISDIVEECVPDKFRSDELLYTAAKHGYLFSEHLTDDLIMTALAVNGWSIRKVPNPTNEMVELALSDNPLAIGAIRDQQEEWCWISIKKDTESLNFIRNPTYEMIVYCLEKTGSLIEIFGDRLDNVVRQIEITDEMKHIAIESEPEAICYIKQTEELAWKAIKLDPQCIRYIKKPTIEMYRYVIKVNPTLLAELKRPLKNLSGDELIEVYKNVLSYDPTDIEYLKLQPEELCIWLVERHPEALEYIYDQTYDIVKSAMSKADVSRFIYDPNLKSMFVN